MSGKNKRPRKLIGNNPNTNKGLGSLTDLSGKYFGQNLPIGAEQSDLYGLLSQLGSGLPGTLGSNYGTGSGAGSNSGTARSDSGINLHGIYDKGSSYIDMLNGAYGTSGLIDLLKSLGNNYGKGLTNEQASDWNKQLLDMILQQYANQEQRAYDRSVLDEQRLYDNPLNQLARLMGAGISRDAAIQMLSGSGSGSASSSGLIGSSANPIDSGIPASQSALNGVQAKTAIANTVFNGFNALAGLVNLGFSVPQAIQQTRYLQNQNSLTSRQLAAYDSTGRAYSILNAAGAAADAFGSVSSASAAIANLAKSGNSDAAQFIASGGIQAMKDNAPFSSHVISDLYRSERSSEDYSKRYALEYRKDLAATVLSEINQNLVAQEIVKAQTEIDNIMSSTEYNNALTETCKALGIKYQAETTEIDFRNLETAAIFGASADGKSYLEWRSAEVLDKLIGDANLAAKTKNPEYAEAVYKEMFNNAESAAAALALAGLKSVAGLEFETLYPEQFKLWQGLENGGAYNYIASKVQQNTSGSIHLPFGIGWTTPGYTATFDPMRPPRTVGNAPDFGYTFK